MLEHLRTHRSKEIFARRDLAQEQADALEALEDKHISILENQTLPFVIEYHTHFGLRDAQQAAHRRALHHPEPDSLTLTWDYKD